MGRCAAQGTQGYDTKTEFRKQFNLQSIGIHFVGRFGDEATLFRLAAQLEAARPWADRRPPVSA